MVRQCHCCALCVVPDVAAPQLLPGATVKAHNYMIVLLVICNHTLDPAFLRSMLSVLYDNTGTGAPVILIHDDHNGFTLGDCPTEQQKV